MTFTLTYPTLPAPLAWEPDEAQDRVLAHREGPLLVLAGPGTGKTATTVELVARQVEAGVPADEVLLLTFSRRAAEEVRERLALRLATSGLATPTPSTFHSFAWSLLRATQQVEQPPLRLLSGPEQDVDLRELLHGSLELGRPDWPASMREGLLTRGMAREVQQLFARARVLGLEPLDLRDRGRERGVPEWEAAGHFFEDYLDVLDAQGKVDYSELVHRAALLAETDPQLQQRWRLVVVDEFQDTDGSQERLLAALLGTRVAGATRVRQGASLVVVGDPDQSIYAFRGADPRVLTGFVDRFADHAGRPAGVLALTACRRSAPAVLAAGRAVAAGLPLPLRAGVRGADHRALTCAAPAALGPGVVEVHLAATPAIEAEVVADLLRAEHLDLGTPWERMAVLVRGGAQMALLERAMVAGGVPVVVAADEVPLAGHPAVQPLLWVLRAAQDPAAVPAGLALDLLGSPLVGADALVLRRLARLLRGRDGEVPRSGDALLAAAVRDPGLTADLDERAAWPIATLRALLERVHAAMAQGSAEALWQAWAAGGLQRRLVRASERGGAAGRAADRDLDAVVALFAAFERSADRHGPDRGLPSLLDELEAQVIPADTLADRGVAVPAVRLLTAHRAKGLEWDVVVVAAVQEDTWPDLRVRASLLAPDTLDTGVGPGLVERLQEERRLFYVATTRARRRLVATAATGEGHAPSSLLAELGVEMPTVLTPRPTRPRTLRSHVAALRAEALSDDEAVRAPAVAQLAALAAQSDDDGRALVPEADPRSWWDLAEPTWLDRPLREPGEPVQLSGSQLGRLDSCALRWFLEREAGGQEPTGVHQGFGTVVHAIAEAIAHDSAAAEPAAVAAQLDQVWASLPYHGPWIAERERRDAEAAIARFARWHAEALAAGSAVLGVEHGFDLVVSDVGGLPLPEPVALRGTIDRVVRSATGQVVVQDLKTSKTATGKAQAAVDPQLGLYQLAVSQGAVPDVAASDGGAALVYPRIELKTAPLSTRTQRPLADDPAWLADVVTRAVATIRSEEFEPSPSDDCDRCPFQRCCPAVAEGQEVVA